jgi:hypothetical protein
VWGFSPFIDTTRNQVYITTGNNYGAPGRAGGVSCICVPAVPWLIPCTVVQLHGPAWALTAGWSSGACSADCSAALLVLLFHGTSEVPAEVEACIETALLIADEKVRYATAAGCAAVAGNW